MQRVINNILQHIMITVSQAGAVKKKNRERVQSEMYFE